LFGLHGKYKIVLIFKTLTRAASMEIGGDCGPEKGIAFGCVVMWMFTKKFEEMIYR
jgi:hypothetical protein